MKRREFLYKANLALAALTMPNLAFGKERLVIWGAPALISISLAFAVSEGEARKSKDLKLNIWKSPDQLRAGFASGDFLLSAAPSNVGVNLAHQGLDVKVLNILTNGLNYIFTKDKKIKTLKDLEGKKLIVPFKNDMPDIILNALCVKMGVDRNKINIHYASNPPQAAQLFIAKPEFDAVLSQEPLASALSLMAKKNGVSVHRQIDIQGLWQEVFNTKIFQAGLIVKGSFYEENKEFFTLLHKDLQNAVKWIHSNQDSAAALGSKYLPAPQAAIKLGIAHSNIVALKASEIIDDLLRFYSIIFETNPQFLGGKMPERSLFL